MDYNAVEYMPNSTIGWPPQCLLFSYELNDNEGFQYLFSMRCTSCDCASRQRVLLQNMSLTGDLEGRYSKSKYSRGWKFPLDSFRKRLLSELKFLIRRRKSNAKTGRSCTHTATFDEIISFLSRVKNQKVNR